MGEGEGGVHPLLGDVDVQLELAVDLDDTGDFLNIELRKLMWMKWIKRTLLLCNN